MSTTGVTDAHAVPDAVVPAPSSPPAGLTFRMILLGGLSLSIGWGIRGNFGHEYGAMIAGALAAAAVVLVSGREDWWRRVAFFTFLGALGWSFGGTISYMQVIAYTHSGHLPSQVYGFACLFVIGFCWAGIGGLGTAAPACLDRRRLTELIPPIIVVFIAWLGMDVWILWAGVDTGAYRHEEWINWKDTDWLAALIAIEAVLLYAAVRGRFCLGTQVVLYAAVGWWIAFLGLVEHFGLRMTPPRGDNWAGALGMVLGLFVLCIRHRMWPILLGGLIAGIIGGLAFPTAQALKLLGLYTGLQTNWHSVLEQTYGFFNGVGIAVAMGVLASRTGLVHDVGPASPQPTGSSTETPQRTHSPGAVRLLFSGVCALLAMVVGLVAVLTLAGMLYHMGLHEYVRDDVMGLHPELDARLGDPSWPLFLQWMFAHMAALVLVVWLRSLGRAAHPKQSAAETLERMGVASRPARAWTDAFCVGLIMIGLTYVNLAKNPEKWAEGWEKFGISPMFYGLDAYWWYTIAFALALAAFVILAVVHYRKPLAVVPERRLGKGQLLYLAFLWVMVVGNLERALPRFAQQRLITEGVIIVNAIVCTVLILLLSDRRLAAPLRPLKRYAAVLGRTFLIGVFAFVLFLGVQTGVARLLYGDEQAPGSGRHIRFGPDATAKGEPEAGKPHP